jgi:hypothetical protein
MPIDISEVQRNDFMGSQAQTGKQYDDGTVTEVLGGCVIVGGEDLLHFLCREPTRQRGMGPLTLGRCGGFQARRPLAAEHEKTQDGSHPGGHQLAAAAHPSCRLLLDKV